MLLTLRRLVLQPSLSSPAGSHRLLQHSSTNASSNNNSSGGGELSGQWLYGELGEEGFERLAAAFYQRVARDDILGPMYRSAQEHRGEDQSTLAPSEARLRDYLVGRFGGPQRYVQTHGHPRLRWRHRSFTIDQAARDRWMRLMNEAMDEALPAESAATAVKTTAAKKEFNAFFEEMSTFMINAD